jgi:hypothetical protein
MNIPFVIFMTVLVLFALGGVIFVMRSGKKEARGRPGERPM